MRRPKLVCPVPQNALHVGAGTNTVRSQPHPRLQSYGVTLWNIRRSKYSNSTVTLFHGVNVLDLPEGPCPKATVVSTWYGVCRSQGPAPYMFAWDLSAPFREERVAYG